MLAGPAQRTLQRNLHGGFWPFAGDLNADATLEGKGRGLACHQTLDARGDCPTRMHLDFFRKENSQILS